MAVDTIPNTDSWIATTTANAPSARAGHTASLDGTEMIVWGGANDMDVLNTGGRYNPNTDSWVFDHQSQRACFALGTQSSGGLAVK